MKRILSLLLVFALLLLSGCGIDNDTPEDTTEGVIKAIKKANIKEAAKYFDNGKDMDKNIKGSTKNIKYMVENIEYKIISTDADDKSATVKVEITNIDMSKIMQDYFKKSFSNFDTSELSSDLTDMSDKLIDYIKDHKDQTFTTTVDVKLAKGSDGWKIEMNMEFLSALLGGAMNNNNMNFNMNLDS